jgi:hypothetical protein
VERRLDNYPVRVQVYAPNNEIIFSTDQRNLFSKYASKRKDSIMMIKKAVVDFQNQ